MKKKNLALFLALTMVAASFVGCGDKKASDNGSAKQEAETETEGSEEGRYLMWRLYSEPKQWDPTNNSESVSDAICKQVFEGLTVSTSDGFKPVIAEKMGCFRGRKNIYIPFKKRCEMVRRKSGDSKRLRIFLEKNL